MRRDSDSNRTKKWVFRNSLNNPDCVNYVTNLCKSFGIDNSHFEVYPSGETALFVIKKDKTYIMCIDVEELYLQLYIRKYDLSGIGIDCKMKSFEKDSCWKKGVEWVANSL